MGLEQGLEGVRKKQEGTESPCCELEGSGLPWGERLKCSLVGGGREQPASGEALHSWNAGVQTRAA